MLKAKAPEGRDEGASPRQVPLRQAKPRLPIVPILTTFITVAIAGVLSWAMWSAYMIAPWTRDATVRVYIVTIAPEVAGQIVQLPVSDNQFVHKDDLLMVIDPRNYSIAVENIEAALEQAKANAQEAQAEYDRRQNLTTLSTSIETKQEYLAKALGAKAAVDQVTASLKQARVNLARTEIRSPVNGYVTNLLAQLGNYANAGVNQLSIVNTDSYWIDSFAFIGTNGSKGFETGISEEAATPRRKGIAAETMRCWVVRIFWEMLAKTLHNHLKKIGFSRFWRRGRV